MFVLTANMCTRIVCSAVGDNITRHKYQAAHVQAVSGLWWHDTPGVQLSRIAKEKFKYIFVHFLQL